MRRRAVMLILDGLGDRPIAELGGKTPLEAARTDNFDRLARGGICGIMDPLSAGIRVGTDVGHLALFGYNPLKVYWGRGPIEAAGVDLTLEPGDVAFRCNFATVDEGWKIIDRRAGRIREGAAELARALDGLDVADDVEVIFRAATEHRAVLVLRGGNLSPEVTRTDPGPEGLGAALQWSKPREPNFRLAARTAELLNLFTRRAHDVLTAHPVNIERIGRGLPPANVIITRGAGMHTRMRSLAQRFHISGACVAGESTILGIAKMAGFDTFTGEKMTANLDTDVEEKFRIADEVLSRYDFVVVHLKGPDIASHDHDPRGKMEFIERVDEVLGRCLDGWLGRDSLLTAVTSDHSTPCALGEHSADPVPAIIHGEGVLTDEVTAYGERACARGGLCRLTANGFLLTLFDLMGVSYRFGV